MLNIITYHSFRSTGMGGVESLIRNIQKKNQGDISFFEVFHKENSSCIEDIRAEVNYYHVKEHNSLIGKLLKRFTLFVVFAKIIFSLKKGEKVIFLAFHPYDLIFAPMLKFFGVKFVLVQTNKFDVYFEDFGMKFFSLLNSYVDKFVVYTSKDRVTFLNLIFKNKIKFKMNKISVIPRGCRLDVAKEKKYLKGKLVTIARVDERQKNFSAMKKILENLGESYSLHIYGGGDAYEINSLIKMIGNDEKIKYMGEAVDVQEILKEYSIFLMTSRFEGFGQTLIEARSQGLPVVLYNTFDAASSIVLDGVNGRLVPFEDTLTFVEAIKGIDSNFEFFSRNSLIMSKDSDIEVVNTKWKNLFSEV